MTMSKDNEKILLLEQKIEHFKELKGIAESIISEKLFYSDREKEVWLDDINTYNLIIKCTEEEIEAITRAAKARGKDCSVCRAARYGMMTACNMCPYS